MRQISLHCCRRGSGRAGRALVAAVLVTLGLAACATRQPAAPDLRTEEGMRVSGLHQLTGRQVREVLGKPVRYRWEGAAGAAGNAIVAADHSVRLMWDTGAANGQLRFTQTGYCNRIADQRRLPETCYRVYRSAQREWTIFRENGEYAGRIHFDD